MGDYFWKLKVQPGGRKYDPSQPRVPAGSPEGGRWTGGEEVNPPFKNESPTDFSIGQRVSWFVWAGGERQELVPGTVTKIGKVRVQVQNDFGDKPQWTYPKSLHPGWKD